MTRSSKNAMHATPRGRGQAPAARASQLPGLVFSWSRPAADPGHLTQLAASVIGLVGPCRGRVPLDVVHLVPSSELIADDRNFARVAIWKRSSASWEELAVGTTTVEGGRASTESWPAGGVVPIQVRPGAFVSANDVILIDIKKYGAGVIVPSFYVAGFSACPKGKGASK